MEKLDLTEEQQELFKKALAEAYEAGKQDATFLANGMSSLVTGSSASVEATTKKYLQ